MIDLDRIAAVASRVARDIRDAAWDWETHGPACSICRAVLRACARELMWCTAALEEVVGAVPEPRIGRVGTDEGGERGDDDSAVSGT